MIFDGHIHIRHPKKGRNELSTRWASAGVDGGVLISLPPANRPGSEHSLDSPARLTNILKWRNDIPNSYAFFWLSPTSADALDMVDRAVDAGIDGFKVICSDFYASEDAPMRAFERIAHANKPILFHSGILWDAFPSSKYNRPAEFECLLEVDRLRFCLAHVGWPWYDEAIAVYGKFQNAYDRRPELSVQMFLDVTPGTPPIYREEVLRKLFGVGYDVQRNVIFGSDCDANEYNVSWTKDWIRRDTFYYQRLGVSAETQEGIFHTNLLRFLGVMEDNRKPAVLRPGQ